MRRPAPGVIADVWIVVAAGWLGAESVSRGWSGCGEAVRGVWGGGVGAGGGGGVGGVGGGLAPGEAGLRAGDFLGPRVSRCARLRWSAHGGQAVCSQATAELVVDHLPAEVWLRDLGRQSLRNLERPERVFQVCRQR